ncbi:DNA-3-methyladenine glycosylase [Microtetraspora sp. AC03309]|nr:DNA-3-methyladenine glycosylase [Microtetraspora sp. AC03309]
MPGGATRDGVAPDGAAPDGVAPDSAVPPGPVLHGRHSAPGDAREIVLPGDLAPGAGTALLREFFDRPSHLVAPDLLGRVIVHGPVAVRLTEVEAYGGPGKDPASHTYRGQTLRNAVMFGHPGHLYVYFTYGMHFCANLVCLPEGSGSAVLLRAGEVIAGADSARSRRLSTGASRSRSSVSEVSAASAVSDSSGADGADVGRAEAGEIRTRSGGRRSIPDRDLARGPARLAVSLDLERRHNGLDCCADGPIRVLSGVPVDPALIRTGPRTGVSAGAETPWRFWIDGDPTVSPYRPHVPRRRGRTEGPQPDVR